jgi:periplasmic copper chaperone A
MVRIPAILTPAVAMAALLVVAIQPALAEQLQIVDPWTPEAPPGRMMAGFMTLSNHGDVPIVLVDARSPLFERVEIHTMIMDDGVMRMRRLEHLTIEPGQSVSLEPGGKHLMLMRPRESLAQGDEIPLTLVDADDNEHDLISVVRPRPTR